MSRRLLLLLSALVGGALGAALPAHADRGPDHDWVCVYVTYVGLGYCQQNPVPEAPPSKKDVDTTVERPPVDVLQETVDDAAPDAVSTTFTEVVQATPVPAEPVPAPVVPADPVPAVAAPAAPAAPDAPAVPTVSEVPVEPEAPTIPDLPTVPTVPTPPAVPTVPTLPAPSL